MITMRKCWWYWGFSWYQYWYWCRGWTRTM